MTTPPMPEQDWEKRIRDKWQALEGGGKVIRSGIRATLLDEFIADLHQTLEQEKKELVRKVEAMYKTIEYYPYAEKWATTQDMDDQWNTAIHAVASLIKNSPN